VDAKAQFRSLAEPRADTGTSTGRSMLAVLGGLGHVERDLIRTRTAEGSAFQIMTLCGFDRAPAKEQNTRYRNARAALAH